MDRQQTTKCNAEFQWGETHSAPDGENSKKQGQSNAQMKFAKQVQAEMPWCSGQSSKKDANHG